MVFLCFSDDTYEFIDIGKFKAKDFITVYNSYGTVCGEVNLFEEEKYRIKYLEKNANIIPIWDFIDNDINPTKLFSKVSRSFIENMIPIWKNYATARATELENKLDYIYDSLMIKDIIE